MTEYYRRVIRITAEDSPNVQLGRLQQSLGQRATGLRPDTNRPMIPGVLGWEEYQKRRKLWDAIRQSIGLDAIFYEGAELLLYPAEWLDKAELYWREVSGRSRRATGIGVDPAEGGDRTAFTAVDRLGVIKMLSLKTPDTSRIPDILAGFLKEVNGEWRDVTFDGGGGGKQIADMLRAKGKQVRVVRFGEGVSLEIKRGVHTFTSKRDVREDAGAYTGRRSQMYGSLYEMLNPTNPQRFGLMPAESCEPAARLRHQLSKIPKLYDAEDRLMLPPKQKKAGQKEVGAIKPLVDLIGYSPDEADSLVLAVDAMLIRTSKPKVSVS